MGYTKGIDSVGVWIKTALDVSSLTLTASDQDATPRSPQGAYQGPDNNFVLGVGFIAATEAPTVPGPTGNDHMSRSRRANDEGAGASARGPQGAA